MNRVIRNFVALLLVVTFSLAVLTTLVARQNMAAERFERLDVEFLGPVSRHVDKALIALQGIESRRLIDDEARAGTRAVPFPFMVQAAVDGVDTHLMEIVRLNRRLGFERAFSLPARAREQLKTLESRLLEIGTPDAAASRDAMPLLDPLRGTLSQLARIYELEHVSQRERFNDEQAERTRALVITATLLLLLAGPLLVALGLRLRHALRAEARARLELAEANESLSVMAMQDELTGLGNRHVFRTRLEQVVDLVKRSGRPAALMYIDLDDFKRINDSMGHDVGDEVLKTTARRIVATVRGSDTVVRLGGDEFTVVITELADYDDAGAIAEKLLRAIAEPLLVADRSIVVHASVGITLMPADSSEATALMKNADMAMYRAKEAGGHRFQFFVEAMNRAVTEHMRMEEELRGTVAAGGFELHYQPQVSLADGRVTGVEALLRWRREDGTSVSPEVFIPVAEHTGLMPVIGEWVLARACRDVAELNSREPTPLCVSVNLSARQFRDSTLVSRIRHALDHAGLPPSLLELELTETMLIDDIETAILTLTTLRELGVRVAIDDFGIGYSSLGYLRRLPIDTLKIDRSFVRDIESDEADRSIVDTIVAMTRTLSLRVVAEGVETRWQLDHLCRQGCDSVQGFLLSRPMPLDMLPLAEVAETMRRATNAAVPDLSVVRAPDARKTVV